MVREGDLPQNFRIVSSCGNGGLERNLTRVEVIDF